MHLEAFFSFETYAFKLFLKKKKKERKKKKAHSLLEQILLLPAEH